jgi:hypothetical protein
MSHISKIKTQMVDKDLILQALDDLGLRYETGALQVESSRGKLIDVEIKVINRLGFDIGLRLKDDAYEIVADWWGVMGTDRKTFTAQLTQRYAYLAVTSRLQQQGFTLASEENKNGKIHLVLRKVT